MAAIAKAQKRGEFVSRSKSQGIILEAKLNPKKHTEETKKKLSEIRKKYLKENPHMVPYLLNHYSKGLSFAEEYFLEVFKNEKLDLEHHLQISLYQLDFYNLEKKLYVEIDGEQHYVDDRIVESDKKRTEFLENLGWKSKRIRWSHYKKLPFEEKQKMVYEIKTWIDSMPSNSLIRNGTGGI